MDLSFFFPNYIADMVDAFVLRDFAQSLEGMGFWGIDAVDHITYPWPRGDDRRGLPPGGVHQPDQRPIEPFTYLAALALATQRIRLRTSIIILPQREPLLVAKQAASIDQLSGGRFELGVGAGWLQAEFQALGASFGNRGRRMDEELELIRRAWMQERITFEGRYYHVDEMSILPKPRQQPHPPIWIGGGRGEVVGPVMRRLGRYGNGWMAIGTPSLAHIRQGLFAAREEARHCGRGEVDFKLQLTLDLNGPDWQRAVAERLPKLQELNADVICLNTIADNSLRRAADHLQRLRQFQKEFGSAVQPGAQSG